MNTVQGLLLALACAVPARAEYATQADRAKPVPLGPPPVYSIPPAVETALANGLKLSLFESHHMPLVAVTLVIPEVNATSDPAGREGLSDFVAAMMKEGVSGLPDAAALSNAFDELGAMVQTSARTSGLTITVTTLKEHTDRAMELISEMVREPRYLSNNAQSSQAFERLKQRTLSALKIEETTPDDIAKKRLLWALFGDNPHGRPTTETSVNAISLADVVELHRAQIAPTCVKQVAAGKAVAQTLVAVMPPHASLTVAGDMTINELKELAEKNFGSWNAPVLPPAPASPKSTPAPTPLAETHLSVEITDLPGDQAEMMLGLKTFSRFHGDFSRLILAVNVLGGPMVGRLDQNIRENKHWAYDARASASAWRDTGKVEMETAVQVDKTGDALREIFAEVKRMAEEPVPEKELTASKILLKGLLVQGNLTVQHLSVNIADNEAIGLAPSAIPDLAGEIDALTAAQVQAAAKKWLNVANLKVVIVGPADKILPQLNKDWDVRVLDPDGREKLSSAQWRGSSS